MRKQNAGGKAWVRVRTDARETQTEAQAEEVEQGLWSGEEALGEDCLFLDSFRYDPWVLGNFPDALNYFTSCPILPTLVWIGFQALKLKEPGA